MVKSDCQEKAEKVFRLALKKLRPFQVQKIDELLTLLGDYGEIRLIVQNGKLRYINNLVSYSVSEEKNTADKTN